MAAQTTTQKKKYVVNNPFTGEAYTTDDASTADNIQNMIKNSFEVSKKGDVGRGGLGGELDKIGNIIGTALGRKSIYTPPQEESLGHMDNQRISNLLSGDKAGNYQVKNIWTGDTAQQQGQKQSSGWLDDLAAGVISPLTNATTSLAEHLNAGRPDQMIQQKLAEASKKVGGNIPGYQAQFMDQDRWKQYQDNPGLKELQDVAGVGSFLIPGMGVGGAGLKGLLQAGASGVVGGALGGLGSTDTEKLKKGDFSDVGTGALVGGVLGTGGNLLGKAGGKIASKLGFGEEGSTIASKLGDFADARDTNAFTRSVGRAPGKFTSQEIQGVMDIAKDVGQKVTSPEDLHTVASQIFDKYGGQITAATEEIGNKGVKVSTKSILEPLEKELSSRLTPELKKPIENAIATIQAATGNAEEISPQILYKLKQELGELASFSPFANQSEKSIGQAFKAAYGTANDLLDNTLSQNGFGNMREINQNLSRAIRAKEWANNAIARARPGMTLTDLTQDTAILGTVLTGGSPLGAIAGGVASKVLQSPATERALAGGARGLANILEKGGSIMPNMGKLTSITDLLRSPAAADVVQNVGRSAVMNQGGGQDMDITSLLQGGGQPSQDPSTMPPGQMTPEQMAQGANINAERGYDDYGNPVYESGSQAFGGGPLTADMVKQNLAGGRSGLGGMDRGTLAMALVSDPGVMKQLGGMGGVKSLLDMLMPEASDTNGKLLPAETIRSISDMNSAFKELDNLRSTVSGNKNRFGLVQGGALGDLAQSLGLDSQRAGIQSQTNTLAQILGKALEGGKLTDSDIQRYRTMLPNLSDTPENAVAKLDQVQQLLQRQLEAQNSALQQGGYNT